MKVTIPFTLPFNPKKYLTRPDAPYFPLKDAGKCAVETAYEIVTYFAAPESLFSVENVKVEWIPDETVLFENRLKKGIFTINLHELANEKKTIQVALHWNIADNTHWAEIILEMPSGSREFRSSRVCVGSTEKSLKKAAINPILHVLCKYYDFQRLEAESMTNRIKPLTDSLK